MKNASFCVYTVNVCVQIVLSAVAVKSLRVLTVVLLETSQAGMIDGWASREQPKLYFRGTVNQKNSSSPNTRSLSI